MPVNIEGYQPPYVCEAKGCDKEAEIEQEVSQANGLPACPQRLCAEHDEQVAREHGITLGR